MNLVEVTAADPELALDIVTVDEMKEHLGIVHDARDAAIKAAIVDAVAFFDGPYGTLNRSVLQRTYRMKANGFPGCRALRLPYPPIAAVSLLSYRDSDGEDVVIDAADYVSLQEGDTYSVVPVAAGGWPAMSAYPDGVVVEFTSGYDPENFPPLLKRGIKLLAAHFLRNTDATSSTNNRNRQNHQIDFGVQRVINQFRIPNDYGDA